MINKVIEIAKEASSEILKIYHSDTFDIELKKDNSPVTRADLISNTIIIKGLKNISNYPIITEESPVDYKVRKNWIKYWLVDPLDGTKDFIKKKMKVKSFNLLLSISDEKEYSIAFATIQT